MLTNGEEAALALTVKPFGFQTVSERIFIQYVLVIYSGFIGKGIICCEFLNIEFM